jgi:rhodanese-related sulfurtransferase
MKKLNLTVVIAFVICAAFAFNASSALAKDMTAKDLVAEASKNVTTIPVADAKALFDKGGVLFLDCREPREYRSGHVPGAVNIPRGLLEFQVTDKIPDKNATIVMYCKSGGRACLACESLGKMGYKNVKNMEGGWKAWSEAGYPVE